MVTGAIGVGSFVILAAQFAGETGVLAVGVMLLAFALICLVSGDFLWQRFEWPLRASLIYFGLQLVAIDTMQFSFSLYCGIYFYVTITQGSAVIELSLFALLMVILTLRAKHEPKRNSPNKAPQATG